MRTLICLFAILATCSVHASNSKDNRVRYLKNAFSSLANSPTWQDYLNSNSSRFTKRDMAFLKTVKRTTVPQISFRAHAVEVRSGKKILRITVGKGDSGFLVNGNHFKLRLGDSLGEIVDSLSSTSLDLRRPAKRDKFSFLLSFIVSKAWAVKNASWDDFFVQVSAPMLLARIDRTTYERETLNMKHELVSLSCDEGKNLVMEWSFEDGWMKKMTIPKKHKFMRYDLADDPAKVEPVFNSEENAFSVEGARRIGGRIQKYRKISTVGMVVAADDESGKPRRLVFSATDRAKKERYSEAYEIQISYELLSEMRDACPGAHRTQFANIKERLETNRNTVKEAKTGASHSRFGNSRS